MTPEAVAQFAANLDLALEVDRQLEIAGPQVPAAKLRWAIATLLADAGVAPQALRVIAELREDEADGLALRP